MNRKISSFVIFVFLLACGIVPQAAFGQTAAELEELLAMDTVPSATAAKFALAAVGQIDADAADNAAWEAALNLGWAKGSGDEALDMASASLLVMRAAGLRGTLWFRVFGGERYAYKSALRLGLVRRPADPALRVSGTVFLQMLGDAMTLVGGDIEADPEGGVL